MSLRNLAIQNQILKILIENQYITLKSISLQLNLSHKSVRGHINKLENFLELQDLGRIESKPGFGIWLVADNDQRIDINRVLLFDVKDDIESYKVDRLYRLLSIIISKPKAVVTRSLLSDMLHVSAPVVAQTILEAKEWLKVFNVSLESSTDSGLFIGGDEASQRLAIKHVIKGISETVGLDEGLSLVLPYVDVADIKNAIQRTEQERNLRFVDEAFDDCLIYSCIVVQRFLKENRVSIDVEEVQSLRTYSEYDFASSILRKVFKPYGVEVPDEEICFLSIHILCSRMVDTSYISDTKEILNEFNEKLDAFIEKLISVLSNIINVDLSSDFELRRGLKLHLKSCVFRLKYDRLPSTRVTKVIKDEYPQTFRISWIVSVLFEEYFNIKINEVELSYIVIYIQSSLERNQSRIKVCLVSSSGMGLNTLISDRLKRKFRRIEDVKIVSLHGFNEAIIEQFDLVISTHELSTENYVRIDDLLSDASLLRIEKKLDAMSIGGSNGRFDVLCHSLFDPHLIMLDVDADSKESLIKMMCERMFSKNIVSEAFYESVIEHERSNSTSIGNLSATPHGDQDYIFESRVVIATLRRPIDWSGEEVQLVFLLGIKTDNTLEIRKTQLFCKQYLNLVDTLQQVEHLLGFEDNLEFYKFLIR